MTMRTAQQDGRVPAHPEIGEISLQQVLEALADPVRRGIARELYSSEEDRACGTFDLTVSKSTATHHFKVLREAGLIRQRYVGTSRMNTLRRNEIEESFPGLLDAILGRGED